MPCIPIAAKPQIFYIRPAPGWLGVCEEEVVDVLRNPLQKYKFEPKCSRLKSTVKVSHCDWRQGLELVFRLKTAHDVEWLFCEQVCKSWSDFERVLKEAPWQELYLDGERLAHVTVEVSQGFSTGSAKLRSKFCELANIQHISEGAILRLKLELREERIRVLVSLAGEPLFKRGYKEKLSAVAPLAEHFAACCVSWVLSQKAKEESLETVWVPFAGSGTLGFESLLVLAVGGPGIFRKKFACETFSASSRSTLEFFRKKMKENWEKRLDPKVVFNEVNLDALQVLTENCQRFKPQTQFVIQEGDFFKSEMPNPGQGSLLILLNPPFGDRLAKRSSTVNLYQKIGSHLKLESRKLKCEIFGGCLCPDEKTWNAFLKALEPESCSTHHFTQGGKEMRIVRWKQATTNELKC